MFAWFRSERSLFRQINERPGLWCHFMPLSCQIKAYVQYVFIVLMFKCIKLQVSRRLNGLTSAFRPKTDSRTIEN